MLPLAEKIFRPGRKQGRLLVGALLFAGIFGLALLVRSALVTAGRRDTAAPQAVRALPDDVDSVLTSFCYAQTKDDEKITISGTCVVRRGRRLLGLRSNLAKTNFIQDLKGTFRSPKGTTSFAASAAEWDAEEAHPLLLNSNVTITLRGKAAARVKNARIFLKRGTLEVDGGSSCYALR